MSDILDDIYAAVTDDEALTLLPARLAGVVDARSVSLQSFSDEGRLIDVAVNYFSQEMEDYYLDNQLYERDVWAVTVTRPEHLNRIVNIEDCVSLETFKKSIVYNELYRRFGDDTGRCMGGAMTFEGGRMLLGMHRPMGARRYGETEVAAMTPLATHLRRLFEARAVLARSRQQASDAMIALEHLADAILVTDEHGRPVLMNSPGEALLRDGGCLRLIRGTLRASNASDDAALQAALRRAVRRVEAHGGALRLQSADGEELRVIVTPHARGGVTRALLVIDSPRKTPRNAGDKLVALYGLTRAEAEIVQALAEDRRPAEIADQRSVSVATVRSQIQAAIRKMDAAGISSAIRLAASIP